MSAFKSMFSVLSSQAPFAAVACDFASSAGFSKSADFTGDADGKQGIFSFWIRATSISGNSPLLANGNGRIALGYSGAALHIYGADSSDNQRLGIDTATNLPLNQWNHVICAWDLNVNFARAYMNDVRISNGFEFANNATLDMAGSGWTLAQVSFAGCLSEVYFAPNQFLDISVEANRRKFISADFKPVDLGSDGSLPTGTAPILYLRQNGSNKLVNSGTGGNFDSVVGTVTNCASSPSDE